VYSGHPRVLEVTKVPRLLAIPMPARILFLLKQKKEKRQEKDLRLCGLCRLCGNLITEIGSLLRVH